METSIILLISGFLFYKLILNNNEPSKVTRLDQLIKHLIVNHSINKDYWDDVNHIKLNKNENGLLIGNDDYYLSFNNNEDIILTIDNIKISLKTQDTTEAKKNLKKIINETLEIINKETEKLNNLYLSFNTNDTIVNIDNKKISLKTDNIKDATEKINIIKDEKQKKIEQEKIKLNKLNHIYDLLDNFKNYYYYYKYLKYKNKYLLYK